MAFFNLGLENNLPIPEDTSEFRLYLTTDEENLYLDFGTTRVKITNFVEIADDDSKPSAPKSSKFYFSKASKSLWKYDSESSAWLQISGGVKNYSELEDLPTIEGKTIVGNLTLTDLNIASSDDVEELGSNVSSLEETIAGILDGSITIGVAEKAIAAYVANSATNATLLSGKDLKYVLDYNNHTNKPASAVVDTELNESSGNAVANSAVTAAINENKSSIETLQGEVDTNKTNISNLDTAVSNLNEQVQSLSTLVCMNYSYADTVHTLSSPEGVELSGYVNICFLATAAFTENDSIVVNNETYTIKLQDGSSPKTNFWVANTLITATLDIDNKTINFKVGGAEDLDEELTTQDELIEQIQIAIQGKASIELPELTNPATANQIFNGFQAIDKDGHLLEGSALSETTTVEAANLFNGKTAYDNNGNIITGTALGTAITANAASILNGKTAYDASGNIITGTALSTASTATAARILNGYKAYDSSGNLITGTALKTASTATAAQILSGYKAYNSSGTLMTGIATTGMKGVVEQVFSGRWSAFSSRGSDGYYTQEKTISFTTQTGICMYYIVAYQGAIATANKPTSVRCFIYNNDTDEIIYNFYPGWQFTNGVVTGVGSSTSFWIEGYSIWPYEITPIIKSKSLTTAPLVYIWRIT